MTTRLNQPVAIDTDSVDFIQENDSTLPSEISADIVADYLKNHPNFFKEHDDLLSELELPHHTGDAVSLVERQVNILRDRNMQMRERLKELMDTVRDNNQLFDKTKRLSLALFDCKNLDEIKNVLVKSMQNDFHFSLQSLILFATPKLQKDTTIRVVTRQEADEHIASILKEKPTLGRTLISDQLLFLFGEEATHVGSSAIVPLGNETNVIGIFAIGSQDDHYFHSGMDTLFLSYVGEVLTRVLQRQVDFAEMLPTEID